MLSKGPQKAPNRGRLPLISKSLNMAGGCSYYKEPAVGRCGEKQGKGRAKGDEKFMPVS